MTRADFYQTWLPNIICTAGGCIISWMIGWKQGCKVARNTETSTRMMRSLLTAVEDHGFIKLARDANGDISGGRVIELAARADAKARVTAEVTAGPATIAGAGYDTSPPSG